ncbi:MAG: DNA polymerase III subunit delta [Ruminococcaceae bacterium]|nr:DNA polymerase III subunit delta [Oscillospiraceae bacterium]
MNDKEFKAEIKKGLHGVYLMYGEEEFLKKYYLREAKKAILGEDDDFSVFNLVEIQDDEFSPELLREAASGVPMMADKICVIAHARLTRIGGSDKGHVENVRSDELFDVLSEIKNIETAAVFIVCPPDGFDAGRKNRPSKLLKGISEHATPVEFAYQTPAVLKKWTLRHFEKEGLSADDSVLNYIVSAAGPDMTFLSLEIGKLIAYAKANGKESVSLQDATLLCSENGELDAFALSNAIVSGDRAGALEALREAKEKRRKAPMVLAGITSDFINMLTVSIYMKYGLTKDDIARKTGIHAFRVGKYMEAVRNSETAAIRAALDRCREADVMLKSSVIDFIALERLVCVMPVKKQYNRY